MKTIGTILKEARIEKNIAVSEIEEITKIKISFIRAIEAEEWESLPPFPTVLGFVKSIAAATGVDEKVAGAILKRDYPPRKFSHDSSQRVLPKADLSAKFVWSPKITFLASLSALLLLLFGYLGNQYFRFISPPRLVIESPKENQTISGYNVVVFGKTDTDAKITVNNQPVEVDTDGKFSVNLNVSIDTVEIIVVASSRSGKVTTVSRRINVQS